MKEQKIVIVWICFAIALVGALAWDRHVQSRRNALLRLQHIGTVLAEYEEDKIEKHQPPLLPPMNDAATAEKSLFAYAEGHDAFLDPRWREPYQPNSFLSGKNFEMLSPASQIVAFYEARSAPDGTRGVVFLDGHAKLVSASQWRSLKQQSALP